MYLNAWKGLFVEVLWIHEEHHHKGLGSKLLSEIEILAKESRFHPMHLDTVNSSNNSALFIFNMSIMRGKVYL